MTDDPKIRAIAEQAAEELGDNCPHGRLTHGGMFNVGKAECTDCRIGVIESAIREAVEQAEKENKRLRDEWDRVVVVLKTHAHPGLSPSECVATLYADLEAVAVERDVAEKLAGKAEQERDALRTRVGELEGKLGTFAALVLSALEPWEPIRESPNGEDRRRLAVLRQRANLELEQALASTSEKESK